MATVEVLSIVVSCSPEGAILTANGRITIDTSPALRDQLVAILHRPVPALTIDLIGVPYIDASGLATLVEALKFARLGKTVLRLRLHERPRYLMEVSGLLHLFQETSGNNACPSGESKC
jgi:anti-sigma B factor antagonist